MPLATAKAKIYYHNTVQMLYLRNRYLPDIQLLIAYLTTRLQNPMCSDYKKLQNIFKYINTTRYLHLILEAKSLL